MFDSDNNYPALENSLFGEVKLTKNDDIDMYKHSGYRIGFDRRGTFSFPNGRFGCNVIIFRVDMGSSIHVDNKKIYILILGEGSTQRLDDTRLTEEKSIQ